MKAETAHPEDQLRGYLGENEEILWSGRPQGKFRVRGMDWSYILMGGLLAFGPLLGLFFGTLMIVYGETAEKTPPGALFALFFIMLLLVFAGLYLMFGRIWWDARRRSRQIIALTRKRLVVLEDGWGRTCKSYDLASMTNLALKEHRDRSGDLTFGSSGYSTPWWGGFGGWPGMPEPTAINDLPDAARVFALLQQQRSNQG
ncbi:MAG: hypothetical protein AAGK14_10715 [Verrucomicrobiota bacterium]